MINIRPMTKTPCALGEGPLWDAQHQRLFWVDSFLGQIFCRDSGGTIKTWQMPCMVGSLAVINLDEILVALQSGLHRFNLSTHTLQLIHDPEPDLPTTRLNDGKTDRAGQFLFASMGVTDRTQGWGGLYRLRREAPGTGWGIADQESFTARGTVPAFDPTVLTLAEAGGVWLDLTA